MTNPIKHLGPLLEFLHVDPWGLTSAKHFVQAVELPFLLSESSGLAHVERILGRLMIRTSKELIMECATQNP